MLHDSLLMQHNPDPFIDPPLISSRLIPSVRFLSLIILMLFIPLVFEIYFHNKSFSLRFMIPWQVTHVAEILPYDQ